MPEIKNTFLGGKMNKDLDERLIPKNEYRDALNIEVSTSQGDDVGSLQNTFGNTAQSTLADVISGGECIGSIVDKENDKIYWFIKGDNVDAIAEYDAKLRLTTPVLVDFGMEETYIQSFTSLDLNPNYDGENVIDSSDNYWVNGSAVTSIGSEGISWNISNGKATAVHGRVGSMLLFVNDITLTEGSKYEIEYDITLLNTPQASGHLTLINHGVHNTNVTLDTSSTGTKKTTWIQGGSPFRKHQLAIYSWNHNETSNCFSIDNVRVREVNRFLKFSDVKNITGINILDGMLFWTDGENEPKKINIERCKAGSYDVVNFGSTSFIGPELISNGDVSTALSWVLPAGTSILNNALETTAVFNSSNLIFSQISVSIKKGHTYLISADLGGSFTQGAIAPFIADELGGTTLPVASQYATQTGTYTWTITAGVTDSNSVANPSGTSSAGVFGFAKQGAADILVGLTFDNISVKEVAFDWNRTTKIKNSLGIYKRDIKEEDITLIKKYPINAPDMQLIGTTKPAGSVINTSCETPTMTTFSGNTNLYNDGSGDKIRYFNFVHTYLREDAVLTPNLPEQNNAGNPQPLMLHVGPDWENIDPSSNGSSVDFPFYIHELNPTSILRSGGTNVNVSNSFTTQPDYYKNAWQEWVSVSHRYHHHLWCVGENSAVEGMSSGVSYIDKISGRVWINTSDTLSVTDATLWKKGDRIVIGYWDYNNNRSFWTYIDGDGATRVKPPGTRTIATTNPDGTILRDDYGGFGINTPTIVDAADKAFNKPGDFGGGWSVVDGEYVGVAHTTNTDVPHGSNNELLEDGTAGFQALHSVITNLRPNTTYNFYFNINVTEDNSPSDKHAFGMLGKDPITGVNVINNGNGRGIISSTSVVLSGNYRFNYLWTTPNSSETSLDISLFKRNDCECTISGLSIDYKHSNPIQIHPLVFSPKPDYEVGDLVEMINSNKAPNGDDIKVVVKLTDEIQNGDIHNKAFTSGYPVDDEWVNADGDNFQAPESWYDDITVSNSDLVDDSDFDLDGVSAFAAITGFASGGNLNDSGSNSADWSTSLEMISNGSFTGNSEGWSEQSADVEHLNYNSNNVSVVGTNAGTHDFPNIRQSQVQNPRLFWEENGEYTISFDHGAITVDPTGGGGIYIRPENTNYFGRTNTGGALFNDDFVKKTSNGSQISAGSVTGLVKWDHSSAMTSTATGFGKVDKNAIRVVALCDDSNSRSTACTVDNVSVLANKNENRISWGDAASGCVVIAGTTSQIISYPQNPTGAKATGGANFALTEGEYYKLVYNVRTNASTAAAATIRLFDCDAWGQTENINSSSGDVQLSTEVGIHYAYWKQSKNATQIHIAFGPGFQGSIGGGFEVFHVTVNKSLDYGKNGSNDNRKVFNTEIISIDKTLTQLPIEDHKYWSCKLLDQEPLFKNVFPRFCYRWKYQDGEYSALSAFTEVAFLPNDTYKYDANDGYNLSMENTVRRVILSSFDNRPSDVVEIDILYKESNSNNIYTFKTIKGAELDTFTEFIITKEKFHSLIESKQILRPYDNIPLKAKAQEISANRIIFGNYTQQYDISPADEPIINTSVTSRSIEASKEVQRSIKSLREYQVGVAYLDKFGRQSPVFSSGNSSFRIEQQNASTSNTISAQLTNKPPNYVSHYKYYVKDSASSFHNISLDRFYQAEESDHVWLSFPSSDFNKIREDDYLVLKKQHNSDNAVLADVPVRYKVLSVKGNAPQFIKMTRKNVGGKIFNTDGKGLEFHSQSSYGGSAAGYPQKDKITFRVKGNIVFENKALLEAFMDNQTGRYIRIGRQIANKPSLFSNYYEILHISRVSANDLDFEDEVDYYEVTLVQPLGHDASFVGSSFSTSVKLFLEYYREELDEFDNHFEGKFFVKIAKNNSFERFIGGKQKVEDSGFNIVNAEDTHWVFQYENVANAATNKGEDTDDWLKIRSLAATTTAEINSLADGNMDWTPSSDEPITANTSSVYNATQVSNFPALHDTVVEIDGTDVDNPFTFNWAGTVDQADWGKIPSGSTTVPQRFCIDQTHTFWMSRGTASYEGENTLRSNSQYANGFVMGNNYCSFAFMGVGEIDFGTDDVAGSTAGDETDTAPDPTASNIDTNTWFDGSDQEISPQWFDNFALIQQMTTVGTQFRWHDDPTHTVYTITKIKNTTPKIGFHRQLPDGGDFGTSAGGLVLSKARENFGYRIDIMLDRTIQWSPTATIDNGVGLNASGTHNKITPLTSAGGTTSQIQVLEKRANELTHTSFNPAVFEIEPKERADLNLYYETPKSGMVLKQGMYIEALNNVNVNDYGAGGNYVTAGDVGTVYKPSGIVALPYTRILGEEEVPNPSFVDNINGWVGSNATGLTLTYQPNNEALKINSTPNSGQYPTVHVGSYHLIDGQKYQVTVDVDSLDNDVAQIGDQGNGLGSIKVYLVTADNAYRPFGNFSLSAGFNVIEFVYDASQATSPSDTTRLQFELTQPDNNVNNATWPAFHKQIIINSASLKTLFVDEAKPAMKIRVGTSNFFGDNPNNFAIDHNLWTPEVIYPEYSLGKDLPSGITIRISEVDESGGVMYFKDYLLDGDLLCDGSLNLSTLPPQQLAWHNCFSFGNGVESNRLRDDFNAVTIDKGPRVSTTLEDTYRQEVKGSGLIFSGIYNSTSSVNQLNQFIQADSITKDLNPEYGTIQKLFTRNTNVVALCENKILKILANKDALFNADGSMQVTSSNSVLGQAIPFVGEYGISRNPESFANFGYRVYFTDKDRGAVLRLSADGLTPISDKDMISFFKSNLPNSSVIVGSYDENRDAYNVSLEDFTISFSENVNGWTSRKSFTAQSGASLNGEYYTLKNSDIWRHHSNALRNNFYGVQYESSVKFMFNDIVDEVKNFNTLNYEGSQSREYSEVVGSEKTLLNNGWYSSSIKTDLENAEVVNFIDKEGKKFNNITGITKTESNIDIKDFTSQGLGTVSAIDMDTHLHYKTLQITAVRIISDIGNDQKEYIVNTSPTDKTQEVTTLSENFEEGSNPATIEKKFYIHANTVNGIKYAVAANKFNINPSIPELSIALTNLGSGTSGAGYHGNIVEITVTIDYSTGSLFPTTNVESTIDIQGSPTLAIDN